MSVAVLLQAYGAIYIEVPKVACSSIKIAFASLLGIDLAVAGGNPHDVEFPAPGASGGRQGLFTFAFVRNPWDRLVSCYRDKILGEVHDFTRLHPTRKIAYCLAQFDCFHAGMPFDEFAEVIAAIPDREADEHFRSQHTFLTDGTGGIALDFVGRFERLDRDFRRVCRELGMPEMSLPFVQAAPHGRDYRQYYTPSTQQLVGERFVDDVSLFGYDFGAGGGVVGREV